MANTKNLKALAEELDVIIKAYQDNEDYADIDDLDETLQSYRAQFMKFDEDSSGDIDVMELKRMMEELGQAKTHLELKKMIAEVDRRNSGTIDFNDFVFMKLGKQTSILKLILMFEEKKGSEKPTGEPLKRDLSSLP